MPPAFSTVLPEPALSLRAVCKNPYNTAFVRLVLRQPQYSLRDDVLLDVGRPAADYHVRPVQRPARHLELVHACRLALAVLTRRPLDLEREVAHLDRQERAVQLVDRS